MLLGIWEFLTRQTAAVRSAVFELWLSWATSYNHLNILQYLAMFLNLFGLTWGAGSLWAILNKECDTRNISHFPHLHAGHKMQDNKRGTRTKRGSNIKISSGRYMTRQPTSSHVTLWTWWLILRLTLWHHFPETEKMMEWAGRARCVECGECGECEEYQPVSVSPSQFAVVRPTHSHTHQHSKLHRNCKL